MTVSHNNKIFLTIKLHIYASIFSKIYDYDLQNMIYDYDLPKVDVILKSKLILNNKNRQM